MSGWSVYVLRCADNSLYTGISTDVERRLQQHSNGRGGARYLKGRTPLTLEFSHSVGDRSHASRIEYRLKQLSKPEKERLLQQPQTLREQINRFFDGEGLLAGDSGS